MSCWWTLLGKKASSDRSLISHCPVPGAIRTRAIASLRRPVPSALPVTTGRPAALRASLSGVVSVVYSDTCSAASSSGCTAAFLSIVGVGSATLLSSCFLSALVATAHGGRHLTRLAAGPAHGGGACCRRHGVTCRRRPSGR